MQHQHDSLNDEIVSNLIRDVLVLDFKKFCTHFFKKVLRHEPLDENKPAQLRVWVERLDFVQYLLSYDPMGRRDGLIPLLYLSLRTLFKLNNGALPIEDRDWMKSLHDNLEVLTQKVTAEQGLRLYADNLQAVQKFVNSQDYFASDERVAELPLLSSRKSLMLLVDVVNYFLTRNSRVLKSLLVNELTLNYFCKREENFSYKKLESTDTLGSLEALTSEDSFFHFRIVFNQILLSELRSSFLFGDVLLRRADRLVENAFSMILWSVLKSADPLSKDILSKAFEEVNKFCFLDTFEVASPEFIVIFLFIVQGLLRGENEISVLEKLDRNNLLEFEENKFAENPFRDLVKKSTTFDHSSDFSQKMVKLCLSIRPVSKSIIGPTLPIYVS